MRIINVTITKAKIKGFTVELRENEEPYVSVTIELLSQNDEAVTTYIINNKYGRNKFDIPINLTEPIVRMLDEFEKIASNHCNDRMKLPENTQV